MLPVQTQGWYSGLSWVPSERHTRQISAEGAHKASEPEPGGMASNQTNAYEVKWVKWSRPEVKL